MGRDISICSGKKRKSRPKKFASRGRVEKEKNGSLKR